MNEMPQSIRVSWERSLASLVDVDHPKPAFVERTSDESVLLRAARPVLESLSDQLVGEPVCLILTDAHGVVLQRGGGDGSLLAALDAVHLAPGFSYAEDEVGTNGIGTALEVGAPMLVNGSEHFTGNLRRFSCAGALITHPVTGALLGVIDITTKAEHTNALLLSFAKLAAIRIKERILEGANELDAALLGGYYAACRHSGGPVIAVGNQIFMMNALAQQHFDANDQASLLDQTRDSVGQMRPGTLLADLPSGITARLSYQPTFVGNTLAGGIIQIKGNQAPRSSSAPRAPVLKGIAGTSATWQHVVREVCETVARTEWVVLQGETGVGKLTLLRAAHRHDGRQRALAVFDAEVEGADLVERAGAELVAGSDLAICRVHSLGPEQLDGLTMLLQDVQNAVIAQDPWVALTTREPETDDEAGLHLLHFFPRTVVVPPLRHHLDDLPALVRFLLNRAGAPELILSKSAINQLMRLPWPNNVTHLARVLASVVRTRRSGVVDVSGLPPECRSTTRRSLSRLEALERDAIILALADHEGDKVAASQSLGMSRATIYRKIRDFGIVD
ncbi:MAG: hypothetical protein L0H93_05155 [Nocardioides sp.]|nr:hypothetical protein [Nocardioides sp.]